MSIKEYFDLIRKILNEPLFDGQIEMLKQELTKHGYSYETGIRTAMYYYNEMGKAVKNGKENTIFQRFKTLIVKDDYYYFCEDGAGFGAQIKIRPLSFERFDEILKKSINTLEPHQMEQGENGKHDHFIIPISTAAAEYLFNELISRKYIPESVDRKSFFYVFCGGDKPIPFYKIRWMVTVELLRIILENRRQKSISLNKFRSSVGLYFEDKKGNARPLPKNKEYLSTEGDTMKRLSIKIGTI